MAHNRKVVGALSVVGATESQIFNIFLEDFPTFLQNIWISGNHLQFAEIPGKFREILIEKEQIKDQGSRIKDRVVIRKRFRLQEKAPSAPTLRQ